MFRLYKFTTVVCLPVVSSKVYNAINAVNVSFTCKADCIYRTFASIGVLFPQSHIDSAPLDLFVLSLSPPIGCTFWFVQNLTSAYLHNNSGPVGN